MDGKPSYASGQILVLFKPETEIEEVRKAVSEKGLQVINESSGKRGHRVTISVPVGSEHEWAQYFGTLPSVRYAELNYIKYTCRFSKMAD